MSFSIDIREESGIRTLHFGSDWIQGAMRIARPLTLELDYTREMMVSLLLRDEARFPKRVLLIGLGAASLTKFIYHHKPLSHLTVVEIEPRVVAAARQFFKLPEDPNRLKIVIDDGAQFIANSDRVYDLILVDGFDANAHAGTLDTSTFYRMARTHLNQNGIMAVNLLGRSRGFSSSLARIRNAFDDRVLTFPSCDSGNAIAFAATGTAVCLSMYDLRDRATILKNKTGLNLLRALTRLEASHICKNEILNI